MRWKAKHNNVVLLVIAEDLEVDTRNMAIQYQQTGFSWTPSLLLKPKKWLDWFSVVPTKAIYIYMMVAHPCVSMNIYSRHVSSAEPWPTDQLGRTISSYERHSLVCPTKADDLFMQHSPRFLRPVGRYIYQKKWMQKKWMQKKWIYMHQRWSP